MALTSKSALDMKRVIHSFRCPPLTPLKDCNSRVHLCNSNVRACASA
jgi:hypothetical protein